MSQNQVEIVLKAVDQASRQLRAAQDGLKQLERDGVNATRAVRRSSEDLDRQLRQLGRTVTDVGRTLSVRLTAPIVALGTGALVMAGNFEQAMNRVQALTGATGNEFEQLERAAREFGATTQFSASQVADAMGFMAQAGMSTTDIMESLEGTLRLAASAQLDMGEAADIVTNILSGYRMETEDLDHAVDVLARAFTSANTDLTQLAEAMKYAGPVASSAGVSFEEAAAAIGLMGNAGIQGSMAGTSLRGAITRLLSPTESAADVMRELGLRVTDAQGRLLPLSDIVEQLGPHADNTAAFMDLFGQRAGPAMAALVAQGSDALRDLTSDLEDSGGTAQRIADAQMQGLNGAMRELRSAVEAAGIAIAQSGLIEWAERLARRAADLLRRVADVNPEILRWGTVVAGVAASIGPLLIAVGSVIRILPSLRAGILAVRAALALLAGPAGIIALVATGLGAALVTAINRQQRAMETAITRTREFAAALGSATDAESLRAQVLTAANQIDGPGRDAFINYAEEAIATADTVEEAATRIRRYWSELVNETEIRRLEVRLESLHALRERQEAELRAWHEDREREWEELAILQENILAAQEAGNERLARVLQRQYDASVAALSSVSSAAQAYEVGWTRTQGQIEAVEQQLNELRGAADAPITVTVQTRVETDPTPIQDVITAAGGAADAAAAAITGTAEALEGSLAFMREQLRAAQRDFSHATSDEARASALEWVQHWTTAIDEVEERFRTVEAPSPYTPAPTRGSRELGPEPAPVTEWTLSPAQVEALEHAREQARALREAEQAALAHAIAMAGVTDGSELMGAALGTATQWVRDKERATREAERAARLAARADQTRTQALIDANATRAEGQRIAREAAEAERLLAIEKERAAHALLDITDGSEHLASARSTNIHLLVREREEQTSHTASLDELRRASHEARVETERQNAALARAAAAYAATPAGIAAAADEAVRFTRAQEQLGDATKRDVLNALLLQEGALRDAIAATEAGTSEWYAYVQQLGNVQAGIEDTLRSLEEMLAAQLAITAPGDGYDQLAQKLENIRELMREVGMAAGGVEDTSSVLDRVIAFVENAVTSAAAYVADAAALFASVLTSSVPVLGAAIDNLILAFQPAQFLATVMQQLINQSQRFRDWIERVTEMLQPFAEALGELLITALEPLIPAVVGLLEALWPLIDAVVSIASALLGPLMDALVPVIAALVDLVYTAIAPLAEVFAQTLSPILEMVAGILVTLFDAIKPLVEVLAPLVATILTLVEVALKPLVWIVEKVVAPIFNAVARMIATAWNAMASAINWALGWLGVRVPLVSVPGTPTPRRPAYRAPRGGDDGRDSSAPGNPLTPRVPVTPRVPTTGAPRLPTAGTPALPAPTFGAPAPDLSSFGFGATPQSIQFAVATPLVEASRTLMDAAVIIRDTFAATSITPTNGPTDFRDSVARFGTYVERLVTDGIRVTSRFASAGPRAVNYTAFLRSL